MSQKNKHGDTAQSGRRPTGSKTRRRVLVLCEDSKSSCFYFRSFPIDPNRIEFVTVGTGKNTASLVEEAIDRKAKASHSHQPFNEIWCVFDRDSFPIGNYNRAFQLAQNHRIRIAWTNEAFEFWYLLHFNYHDTAISRDAYAAKLRPYLQYDKADENIYEKVRTRQEIALGHARRLEKQWNELGERNPETHNPSTSVHKLVEFLNELADLGSID